MKAMQSKYEFWPLCDVHTNLNLLEFKILNDNKWLHGFSTHHNWIVENTDSLSLWGKECHFGPLNIILKCSFILSAPSISISVHYQFKLFRIYTKLGNVTFGFNMPSTDLRMVSNPMFNVRYFLPGTSTPSNTSAQHSQLELSDSVNGPNFFLGTLKKMMEQLKWIWESESKFEMLHYFL